MRDREDGFTLIEVLVVVIVIGILLAIALPSFLSQSDKAEQAQSKSKLSTIYKVIKSNMAASRSLPADAGAVNTLLATSGENVAVSPAEFSSAVDNITIQKSGGGETYSITIYSSGDADFNF
jgi:type IV pilus assembly protein PilA